MKKKKIASQKKCFFCQEGVFPNYKEVEILRRFISERGKIIPRIRSGVCAKHQRILAREIKRARYLALLHFVARV